YLISKGINFQPLFIEKRADGKICFLKEEKFETIIWRHIPEATNSYYLGHYCNGNKLTYISQVASNEISFPNPFKNQSEYELRTFSAEKLLSVLYFVKTTHTAMIPSFHIPYINAHGENLLLPFDKYSIDENKKII